MPPKKRERDNDAAKNPIYEQIQADHEMFLQAFEKPTQIYRFLRTRNLVSPVFSERTVTYMRHRMSRSHKNRANFKIDSLLSRVLAKQKETQENMMSGYMTLAFTGFFDKNVKDDNGETVSVETIILKNCHKKRKDVSAPIMQTSVGKSKVLRNPDPSNLPEEVSAISVPSNNFSLSNGHLVKSYVLLLRVSSPSAHQHLTNGICNGELSDSGPEPPTKKRKNGKIQAEETNVFGAELIIYDKHNRCLLNDGEYELVLQEIVNSKGLPKKHCSWETFLESKDKPVGPFDAFDKGPTLKFRLTWSDTPVESVVPTPLPLVPTNHNNNHINNHIITRQSSNLESKKDEADTQEKKKKTHIFYQFLYNNNTRQQTEARDDLHCPWCSLNCEHLYSLLKHLKLCHSRFIFTYVPHPRGARIDVSINECYDGSYSGNPHDLLSQPPGFAFSRNGPVRRTPVTNLLVCCRPKRSQPSLSEFLEPDDSEFDGPRPLVSGHSRCYHHTISCLPIEPQELEIDSEDENDPEWLRSKTKLMIDEFTDVNEGEKELMKMWNLHIMKYGFVGDCQIPLACSMFIEKHSKELVQKKLYKNFILHMCNLYDFGLIGAAVVFKTVRELQEVKTQMENEQKTNPTHDNKPNGEK